MTNTAVEETIDIRYMLICVGGKVKHSTPVCGNKMSIIQNATILDYTSEEETCGYIPQ